MHTDSVKKKEERLFRYMPIYIERLLLFYGERYQMVGTEYSRCFVYRTTMVKE